MTVLNLGAVVDAGQHIFFFGSRAAGWCFFFLFSFSFSLKSWSVGCNLISVIPLPSQAFIIKYLHYSIGVIVARNEDQDSRIFVPVVNLCALVGE